MANSREISKYIMLREAIKNRDRVLARNLILNNANVNIPNAKGASPLHWAIIKFDDVEIITMLLDRGANIHAMNHRCHKPLEVAIQENKTEAILLLIRKGALYKENLNSSLLMAIEQYNYTIVKILIDNSMQYNQLVNLNISLNAAICQGHLKIIKVIKPHCQFLKPSDKYVPRDIVIKSSQRYKECVELLLKWNFTVDPNSNRDKDFVYGAVENGHLRIVLQLLKLGIDVNLVNSNTGLNLLKIACLNTHHEIIENLLKHGACVNVTTPTNTTKVKSLSYYYYDEHGYNHPSSLVHNKNDARGITCLHIAVLNSDPMMTRILLKYGAKIIDDPTFFYITCIAVKTNCEEIVRMFLDQGVNVNDVDAEGKSLLHFCVNTGNYGQDFRYNIVKLLLERGATVQIKSPRNPLIFEAVKNGHHKIAQLLLDYNANIQYISLDGNTLLHKAIEKNFSVDFIKTLLIRNSPVNVVNNYLLTPLLIACSTISNNQLQIIKILLYYNANVNCDDHSLMTPLHFACQTNNLEIVTALLEKGSNPNTTNGECQTPLHIISKHKSDMTADIIQLLLERGVNIEAVDARGWTPLFHACDAANDIAVKCLLDNNANANHTDLENLTPLYISAQNCRLNSEVIKFLLERKVNTDCIDKQGKTILDNIVENNNLDLIKYLLHTQVDLNSVNKEGNTPLHTAIENESANMTETLIKYGSNVNIVNKKNQTPLQNARNYLFYCQDNLYEYCKLRDHFDEDHFNTYFIDNDIHKYEKIVKMLRIQIVKLNTAGLKVNKQDLNTVYNSVDYDDSSDNESTDQVYIDEKIDVQQLEIKCKREIEKIKTENIGVNNMTLYNLMKKNIHTLSRYVKNKKIQQNLDLEVNDERFPLYIDIIRSRFRDAILRYKSMNAAKKYFSLNVCQRLSNDYVDAVFSYLSMKDLKMFIKAMKPLDE